MSDLQKRDRIYVAVPPQLSKAIGTPLFQVTIPGRPIVKKNTQRVVGRGQNKRAIYSPQFKAWQNVAFLTLRSEWREDPLNEPLELWIKFFFKDRQGEADLSNLIEGPQDVLTDAGVIQDDKLIRMIAAEKIYGEEPRTEIALYAREKK